MCSLPPGNGRNVFRPDSLFELFLLLRKYQGKKLFFFTDSPSGFPNSGNKRLRAGYAAGKENIRRTSYPRKTVFATILLSSRKSEFELGGINYISPSPELGTLEILSEFSSGNREGKAEEIIKFPFRIL